MTLMPLTRSTEWVTDVQPHPGRRLTEEEFVAWVRPKTRAEWVDGEVIIMAPDNNEHSDLVGFLSAVLRIIARRTDAGEVRGQDFAVRFPAQKRRRVPDLLFIRKSRTRLLQPNHLEGPADLMLEIISPDSVGRDYTEKFGEYAAAGVKEYWIVDPLEKRLVAYALTRSKQFKPMPETGGLLRSKVLPPFALKLEWLFPKPADEIEVLRELGVL
jgi:Uma2 family endonuclease